jgi:steroid 5-alpha reductase family enzyme
MNQLRAIVLVTVVTLIMGSIAYVIQGQSITLFGLPLVMASAALCLGINLVVFIPATITKTEKYFDLTGSITYLLVMGMALYAMGDAISLRVICLATLVCIWALRLGTYLMRRIHADGKDGRFDELKKQPSTFIIPWILQALWVFLTSLAVLIIMATHPSHTELLWSDILGGAFWLVGFIIEVMADAQKSAFRKDPQNQGQFIQEGLWRYSQHPNYFGEILLWTGMFVVGAGFYEGTQWLALISPLFIYLLLTKISGINLLDERAAARWGNDPKYQSYQQKTAVLFLRPPQH